MFLNRIVNCKKEEVSQRKSKVLHREYSEMVRDLSPPRDFKHAIKRKDTVRLIGEIKKSSPSKGDIRPDLNPLEVSEIYQKNGVASISVLTEQFFFKGSIEDLTSVKKHSSLPILQKDFFIDVFQIYEARVLGADAILLIAAILEKNEMEDYINTSKELGLAAIIEVHSEEELEKALNFNPDIIGINNRNLQTFEIDMKTTINLSSLIPDGTIKISESGINSAADMKMVSQAGIDAVLVGESLMRSDDIALKVQELLGY